MKGRFKKAFTLVELIIVIVILTVLSAIVFISLKDYPRDARDTVRKSDLNHIAKVLELYNFKSASFPQPDNKKSTSAQNGRVEGEFGTGVFNRVKGLNILPTDPKEKTNYQYFIRSDNKKFKLIAHLETGEDHVIERGINQVSTTENGSEIISGNTDTWDMLLVYTGLAENDVVELPFRGNTNIKQIDWGVGGENCEKTATGIVSCTYGADVSNGETTIKIQGTSEGYGKINNISLGVEKLTKVLKWDMGFVDISYGFFYAGKLVEVPASLPTTVKKVSYMFGLATSFNSPINTWNTEHVTDMSGMFNFASSFNQSLSNFKTQNVVNMESMFDGAIAFNKNISCWNVKKIPTLPTMFGGFGGGSTGVGIGGISDGSVVVSGGGSTSNSNFPIWGTDGSGGSCN